MVTKTCGFLMAILFASPFLLGGCGAHSNRESLPKEIQDLIPDNTDPDCKDLVPPQQTKAVSPIYPAEALIERKTGVVYVKILVDTTGTVTEASVVRDSGTKIGFEEAAIQAAYKTKWNPAMCDDKPMAIYVVFQVDFNIK